MSSMKDAMTRAGINPIEAALLKALATYLGAGGTVARLNELVAKATDGMLGAGHRPRVREDQIKSAPARQPNGDEEGHSHRASDGQSAPAPSSPPNREAEGHCGIANKADHGLPTPRDTDRAQKGHVKGADKAIATMPSVREPSKAAKAAAKRARMASATAIAKHLGWIGTAAIPGGPAYIQLRVRDLEGMARRQIREAGSHAKSAVVLKAIERAVSSVGVVDRNALWVDVIPPEAIAEIARKTEDEALKPVAMDWLDGFRRQAERTIEGAQQS